MPVNLVYEDLTFSPAALTPFPSSSTWNRRFSKRITDPGDGFAHAASTSGPTQSLRKTTSLQFYVHVCADEMAIGQLQFPTKLEDYQANKEKGTYFPNFPFRQSATGLRENFSFGHPFGRPKWDISTTDFAPLSRACLIVGNAASILKIKRFLFKYIRIS